MIKIFFKKKSQKNKKKQGKQFHQIQKHLFAF
jgi:hypothetical protein